MCVFGHHPSTSPVCIPPFLHLVGLVFGTAIPTSPLNLGNLFTDFIIAIVHSHLLMGLLVGTALPGTSTYYYGDVRYRARHGWPARKLEDSLVEMAAIEEEDRITVRAAKPKASGFTGLSTLHRLHHLYGFDVQRDMVYDAMHNVPMNVIGQHLHHYVQHGFFSNDNKALVEKRLDAMPWTAGLCTHRSILPHLYISQEVAKSLV